MMQGIFRRLAPAPRFKAVAGLFEVPTLNMGSVNAGLPVEVDANVLLPVVHVDLMGHKAEVFPSIVSDVTVDVIDIPDGLCVGHQKEGNTVLKEGLIAKVHLLISGCDGRFNYLSVFREVIGVVNPPQFTRLWAVAKTALKFTRYRLQFHVAIILFPQVMSNHG